MSYSKPKIFLLESLRWILILLLVFFIFIQLSGNQESSTGFETMKETVLASAELSNMQESDNMMVKRLYGLEAAAYDGIMLYAPTTNMGAEELLLVKLKDISQQEVVIAAMESRVQTQKDNFEGYGVEQFAMLENCVLEIQGNYILLVIAADPAPVKAAFLDAL